LLDCLVHLDIDHTAHGGQLLACVNAILKYQTVPMITIAVSALLGFSDDNEIPLDWVKESWHSVLYADSNRQIKNRFMNNDNFELCLLSEVSRRFQSGDLYVGNSTVYDDYRTDLVSCAEIYQRVDAFCEVAGIDKTLPCLSKHSSVILTKRRSRLTPVFQPIVTLLLKTAG
jgi:hypothetical protein